MRRNWMRWDVILTAKLLCSACRLSDSFIEMAPHAQAPLLCCFITAACDSTPHHSGQQSYQLINHHWKQSGKSHKCLLVSVWQQGPMKNIYKHHPITVWLGFIITPNGLLNDWHLFTGWVMRWSLGLFYCCIIHYYFIPIYVVSWHYAPSKDLQKYRFDKCTSVGIKITKYTLRERQICICEGQDLTLIYYLMQHIKKQHINTLTESTLGFAYYPCVGS